MTTRSGRNYKAMSTREAATPFAAGNQGTSVTEQPQHSHGAPHQGRGPASVEDILRLMIKDRTRREEEFAEER